MSLPPAANIEEQNEKCADHEETQQQQPTTANANNVKVDGYDSVAAFAKIAMKTVVAATRVANAFPQGPARDLYCAHPTFGRVVDHQSNKVLGVISKVLKAQNVKGNIQTCLQDEQFDMIQECNDILFERLNINLDIKSGHRFKQRHKQILVETEVNAYPSPQALQTHSTPTPSSGSWNQVSNYRPRPVTARLLAAKNIERPQVKFKKPVDNSSLTPFVPKLKEKPNSLKPLAILPEYDDTGMVVSYLHPYEFELLKFDPSVSQLARKSPAPPKKLEETELLHVDTVPKLQQALQELQQAKEIAIDVEHHSYRTFMGITCLVQMSTRDKDYIFDTFILREELHVLNLVLTDPKIVKILHGADLDIEWLQRDLALYIVNMFDTHKAAKALKMARVSLSFLLKHYINLDVDKKFQLADWRMRPLPEELVSYARQDTHYLIYIYEVMTNDLLDLDHGKDNTLRVTYQHSTEVCKKRYRKPQIEEDSHLVLLRKSNRVFDNRQMSALRDIFRWRDETARLEDESYGYVLPNHMMLQIAESIPREMQGILACCNPIPPPVRQQLHKLHEIILRARNQPLIKPIISTENVSHVVDFEAKFEKLYNPHDLLHMEDMPDDLPTLLDKNGVRNPVTKVNKPILLKKPSFSLFEKPKELELSLPYTDKAENDFLRMPYKRYRAILPFLEKKKREAELRAQNEFKNRVMGQTISSVHAINTTTKSENTEKVEDDDNLYRLPLKEQLKRKYQAGTPSKEVTPIDTKRLKQNQQKPIKKRIENNQVDLTTNVKKETSTNSSNNSKSDSKTMKPSTPQSNVVINISDSSDDNQPPEEKPIGKQEQATPPQNRNKQKQNNKFKDNKPRLHPQSSNRPITLPSPSNAAENPNFDYGQVDFRQFKGGGQRARGAEFKSQHQAKNQPHKGRNKQFNKLFTFSHVKNNKK